MLRSLVLASAICALAGSAAAQCSSLTVTNTNGTVDLDLDGSDPMAFGFFVIGETAGTTTVNLGSWATFDLGLVAPFYPVPAGLTDANGDVSYSFELPANAPAGTWYVQGVTVGFGITPGTGITFDVCASNVATLSI